MGLVFLIIMTHALYWKKCPPWISGRRRRAYVGIRIDEESSDDELIDDDDDGNDGNDNGNGHGNANPRLNASTTSSDSHYDDFNAEDLNQAIAIANQTGKARPTRVSTSSLLVQLG